MDLAHVIALSMGLAWASGLNLYAAILMLGVMGATGHIALPPDLEPLTHPVVIAAAAFMYCVEFFADKVPGVDTGWDTLHTFIRIPAGAVLAAGAIGDVSLPAQIAAALIGGSLSAGRARGQGGQPSNDQRLARAGDELDRFRRRGCGGLRRFVGGVELPDCVPRVLVRVRVPDRLAVTENLAGSASGRPRGGTLAGPHVGEPADFRVGARRRSLARTIHETDGWSLAL